MQGGRRRAVLALMVAAVGLAAGCGAGDDPASAAPMDVVRVQLDWIPNTNHAGLYTAIADGTYAAAGLEVELLPYASVAAEPVVASGRAEVGVSFQDAVTFAVAGGVPVRSIFAVLQTTPEVIGVDGARADITRPKDLDGLRYAGFGLPSEQPRIATMIRNDGGSGEFETVTGDLDAYSLVASGQADFTIPFATWQVIQADLAGTPYRTFRFTDYGIPDWYGLVLVAASDALDDPEQREVLERFVAATADGYQAAAADRARAAEVLRDAAAGTEGLDDVDLVERSLQVLADDGYFLDADGRAGRQTSERWDAYTAFLVDNGLLVDDDGGVVGEPIPADDLMVDLLTP
jgi:ABC-type nitrate/sulfonate/bicarbonate transport system substrate-binding protein